MNTSDVIIQLEDWGYLEVAQDFPASFTYVQSDVAEVNKKNNSFSKTIYCPFTKNNHKVFGHYFNVNVTNSTFDINRKVKATVLQKYVPIFKGFVQLLSVKKQSPNALNGDEKGFYEVKVYDEKTNFYDALGNGLLTDLDFSRFNHTAYYTEILGSSGNTYLDGYIYPHYNNPTTSIYETCDFRPSIFLKTYVQQIFKDAGYTYTCPFFDSDFFERLIIPYNGDYPVMDADTAGERQFQASIAGTQIVYLRRSGPGGLSANTMSALTSTNGVIVPYNDDTNALLGNFDSGNTFNTTLYKWTCPAFGIFDFNVTFGGSFLYSASTNGWRYKDNPGFGSPLTYPTNGFVYLFKNGIQVAQQAVNNIAYAPSRTNTLVQFPSSLGPDLTANTQYITNFSVNNWTTTLGTPSNLLVPGDTIEVRFKVLNPYMDYYIDGSYLTWTGSTGLPNSGPFGSGMPANSKKIPVTCSFKFDNTSFSSKFKNVAQTVAVLSDLDTINLNSYIPANTKKRDFWAGLISLFNLVIEQDPTNEKNLLIWPRSDYYGTETEFEDWTDKICEEKESSIKFLADLQSKKLKFTYTQDESSPNLVEYLFQTQYVFGSQEVEFVSDFLTGERIISTLFSPTPIVKNYGGNIVSDIDSRAPKNKIRILYCKSGLFSGGSVNTWQYKHLVTGSTAGYFTTTHTGTIWAGHFAPDPIYPDTDLNFGRNQAIFYDELSATTTNTTYNAYWYNWVTQIANGKLLTAYFDLNSSDIFKLNFRKKIFILDAFYYLNKVIDYNAIDPNYTKVELIKIDEGLRNPPFVKRRFNVILNAGPQNTYTSTARMSSSNSGVFVSPGVVEAGNYNYAKRPGIVVGTENTIQEGVENNFTMGQRNNVAGLNNVILGSSTGNTINANGVILINTSNKTVLEDNVTYFNGIKMKNGVTYPAWNDIDCGSDRVYYPFSNYMENDIDCGVDTVRKGGGISPISNIEAGEDSVGW